jgi:hypothetical protein
MLTAAWLLLAVLAQLGGDARRSDLEVRASGGAVTIHVRNLPLSQILDRLAAATGMTLTYEGSHPSTPVSLNVDDIPESEAVVRLMEGLGVSYVFRTDPTGRRVDLLIMSPSGAGSLVAASAQPAQDRSEDEPVAEYGHIPLDPAALEAAGGQTKPDLNNPYLGLPPQLFPQAAPGYQPPPPMDDSTGSTGASGSRNMPPPPTFPQNASHPRR